MINLSELSKRRIRSINRLVRVNRTECVQVLRVDKEKGQKLKVFPSILFINLQNFYNFYAYDYEGYIDLSKKNVEPEDIVKCEERYNKAKAVHSVLRYAAEQSGQTLESLYESVGWPLYQKYEHAYDAFKLSLA